MPIRPELRQFYGREWRTVTRPRILARAANCCERCGVPNHSTAVRYRFYWRLLPLPFEELFNDRIRLQSVRWKINNIGQMTVSVLYCRVVRIVLTIAHLNHQAGDDRDENLLALCQWCHLSNDRHHHHETRAARKDAGRPILRAIDEARA